MSLVALGSPWQTGTAPWPHEDHEAPWAPMAPMACSLGALTSHSSRRSAEAQATGSQSPPMEFDGAQHEEAPLEIPICILCIPILLVLTFFFLCSILVLIIVAIIVVILLPLGVPLLVGLSW